MGTWGRSEKVNTEGGTREMGVELMWCPRLKVVVLNVAEVRRGWGKGDLKAITFWNYKLIIKNRNWDLLPEDKWSLALLYEDVLYDKTAHYNWKQWFSPKYLGNSIRLVRGPAFQF